MAGVISKRFRRIKSRYLFIGATVGIITVITGFVYKDVTSIIFGAWLTGIGTLDMLTWKQEPEEERRAHSQHLQRISNHVDPYAFTPGYIQLGKHLKYGVDYPEMGVTIDRYNMVGLSFKQAFEHALIIGKTGSGKTYYAINWLVHQFLHQMPEAKIIVMECKGSSVAARSLVSRIAQHHRQPIPLFMLGMEDIGTLYDGFRGTSESIYDRLVTMLNLSLMDENPATGYYADAVRLALTMACEAPCGPPKSMTEAFHRIRSKQALNDLYKHDDDTRKYKKYRDDLDRIDTIDEAALKGWPMRLATRDKRSSKYMGRGGFTFEDPYPGMFFSFKTSSAKDDVNRDLLAKMADFHDFMGNTRRQGKLPNGEWKPAILIIDEFKGIDVELLLRQCREFNIMVILATQDESLLGKDDNEKQRIMSSIGTFIAMRSDYPERLVKIAGTKEELKVTTQYDRQGPTDKSSVQEVEKFIVPPSEVKGLADGEAFVIRSNLTWMIKFPPAPKVEPNSSDIAIRERVLTPQQTTEPTIEENNAL